MKSLRVAIAAFLIAGASHAQAPLSLSEVLESAVASHPALHIAQSKVESAEGDALAARGNFDLKLEGEGSYAPVGTYDKSYGAIGVRQPTAAAGLQLWARYENGANFAPYNGGLVTSEGGKASLGFVLPLLQGSGIDAARVERFATKTRVEIAEQERRQATANLLAAAAKSWWGWLIAGEKLRAYQDLADQAEERRNFVKEQIELGALPPVELFDSERLLAQRRTTLAQAELSFRRKSLELGMFRRTDRGMPLPARIDELPPLPELAPARPAAREELKSQLARTPQVVAYTASLDILGRELRWAKNQALARLDFEGEGSQSFGATRAYSDLDTTFTETTIGAKLKLSWDVPRRKARGKAAALQAKTRMVESQRRLLLNELGLAFEAQWIALESQYEMAELAKDATDFALKVSEAETEAFALGQSSVLATNLREQAYLSTYITELDSILAFQSAWLELHQLVGSDDPKEYELLPAQPVPAPTP